MTEVYVKHAFLNPQPDDAGPHVYTLPSDWNAIELFSASSGTPTDGDLVTYEAASASKAAWRTITGSGGVTVTISATGINISTGSSAFIDGSGTAGQIPKFVDANTLTNSIVSEAAGVISIAGSLGLGSGGRIVEYNGAAPTNGQLLIGNTAGARFDAASLTGTANQIVVTPGAGSITLSAPQDLDTAAAFRVGSIGLGVAAGAAGTLKMTGKLTRYNDTVAVNGQILIGNTSTGAWDANTLTAGSGVTIDNTTPGQITIAATGTITGTGTSGRMTRWTGATAIGDGTGRDDGSTAAFGGVVSAAATLKVYATAAIEGILAQGGVAQYAERVQADTTSGSSLGLLIRGGTTSADSAIRIFDATAANENFRVRGDGVTLARGRMVVGAMTPQFTYVMFEMPVAGVINSVGTGFNAEGMGVFTTLKPDVGALGVGIVSHVAVEMATSGDHGNISGCYFEPPVITSGGATTAVAATVTILSEPSGGVRNYALLVGGRTRISTTGPHAIGALETSDVGIRINLAATQAGNGLVAMTTWGGTMTATGNGVQMGAFYTDVFEAVTYATAGFTVANADMLRLNTASGMASSGGGTITNASVLHIGAEPAIATNNYAILVDAGRMRLSDGQKHSFGGAWKTYSGVTFRGSIAGDATNGLIFGYLFEPSITPSTNDIVAIFGIYNGASITKVGTNPVAAGMYLKAPTLTGGGTATVGATAYIEDATSGATTNYALYVADGSVRAGGAGPHAIGTALATNCGFRVGPSATASGGAASVMEVSGTVTAAANNDLLAAFDIGAVVANVTVAKGAFTGLDHAQLHLSGSGITVSGAGTIANASSLKISSAPSVGTTNYALWIAAGNTRIEGSFAHGGAINANILHRVTGSFTGASDTVGFELGVTLTGVAGNPIYGFLVEPAFVVAGSGNHSIIASFWMNAPTVTAGAATVTDTAVLYIQGAMSATVSGANYAVWVDAGATRLDGSLTVQTDRFVIDASGNFGLRGGINTRAAFAFGGAGSDAYVSTATSTNDSTYFNVRPASIANTSDTGDIHIFAIPGSPSLNPTGASALGTAFYLDAPGKGGAGSFTTMATFYISDGPSGGDTNNYALFIDAGLSRFDGNGTDVFELPADATDPTGGGGAAAGRIAVKIGGATKYLAYY